MISVHLPTDTPKSLLMITIKSGNLQSVNLKEHLNPIDEANSSCSRTNCYQVPETQKLYDHCCGVICKILNLSIVEI